MKKNEETKTQLLAATLVAFGIAGIATLVVPNLGEILAGLAVAGALFAITAMELKQRVY